jgi:hypothetical protein
METGILAYRGMAEFKPVERAVLLATPAVLPAASAGETAGMAGLAICSTADVWNNWASAGVQELAGRSVISYTPLLHVE